MNLHEYQAKEILNGFGVRIQRGYVANTPDIAVEKAKQLNKETGTDFFVIKAQVHAGGRGKGGGVKLAKSIDEVHEISDKIIGMNLITPQTSSEGKKVRIEYRSSLEKTVKDILGGIRSSCTYVGAPTLKQLSKCTTFVRVNNQYNDVFGRV